MDIETENDESWKEEAQKEKERLDAELRLEKERMHQLPPEPTFGEFLAGLAVQALVALGETENPLTRTKEVVLPQAKYVIDVIALLKEKTKGNLNETEQIAIDNLLTDLRLKFVKASEQKKT